MIVEAIKAVKAGKAEFTPQNEAEVTLAPMLSKQDGLIEWNKPTREIFNFIRGMNPWPCAHTYLGGKTLKIYGAQIPNQVQDQQGDQPGKIIHVYNDAIAVKTSDGLLLIKELQLESKKKLSACEFIKGYPSIKGNVLLKAPASKN